MAKAQLTKPGMALTDMVLDLFRLNSLLLMMGDRLVGDLGLTSARWQVLGAIVSADRPQPVAWIARDLGGNRQNVLRIVNDLHKEGFVDFEPNPHHKRAQLVIVTEKGRKTFERAMELWTPWANSLADSQSMKDIETMGAVVKAMRRKLEEGNDVDDE
jgi:DNA-binding MarR family transcriptional regulator